MLVLAGILFSKVWIEKREEVRWEKLLKYYRNSLDTDCMIFVKCQNNSRAQLEVYKKRFLQGEYHWRMVLSCGAYIGKSGIGKAKEGDGKTPAGNFPIIFAFGIKENPGTQLPYTKVQEFLYWSEEKDSYNQLVDVRKTGRRKVKGEHLIEYQPEYHYAVVLGYNMEGIYGKGSAIFLHCKGANPYTAGCVAISERNMVRVLNIVTERTRICIYPK